MGANHLSWAETSTAAPPLTDVPPPSGVSDLVCPPHIGERLYAKALARSPNLGTPCGDGPPLTPRLPLAGVHRVAQVRSQLA